jgi:hypothetical protein
MGIRLQVFNLGNDFAELDFQHVYLQAAVDGFELRLAGKLLPKSSATENSVSILTLDIEIALQLNGHRLLAEARGDNGASHWNPQHGEGQVHFSALISGAALEAIEEAREGGELVLQIRPRGLVNVGIKKDHVTAGLHPISANSERVALKRSDWENALESCGYGKLIRFALNLGKAEHSQAAVDAYRYLDSAQKVLRHSEYRSAIENSRKALSRLREAEGLGLTDHQLFKKAAESSKDLTEPEREALVRAALQSLSQSSVHDGDIEGTVEPNYSKAAAMLYMAGLTTWLAEQRRETELRGKGGAA